ncbi:ABC transporter permease [Billgrantia endophytica]|uniref:Nitrate ABC transporter permease n=1 Tax=Billgrantia endophytica TaxID=2033802 RepID=A0A2N7U6Q5_9GAMM|nr:ABC transporter permease [Halomonas endophytica]PMR76105.1 nitrate ABC transporter permease [Halomonas endophytica]
MSIINQHWSLILQRLVLVSVFVIVWWLASLQMPAFILPGPQRVIEAVRRLFETPSFLNDVSATFRRVLLGFTLAMIVGATLGLLLGANKILARFFEPVLAVINTVSSAIWAIFAIIWFGISDATTVFVVFMTAMPLILTNVWQGVQTVDRQYIQLALSLRMSKLAILRKIVFPSILPYFFSSARLAFGFGWRVSLVAETIGASEGIGYRLRQAADLVQTDQVFAWTLLLVMMMLFIESSVLKPLEKRLFRWKATT